MSSFFEAIKNLYFESGIYLFFVGDGWKNLVMIGVACGLIYLAIKKQFEPLLLLPIAFGMLLANLPGANLGVQYHDIQGFIEVFKSGNANLMDLLYVGVKAGIYPPLIFLGVGAMTDFGPLIANPKSFLLGAAAQLGIFGTFIGAACLGFGSAEAGSIAIIGGADGPTAIYVASKLLTESSTIQVGTIAVAAYSYMALVPFIQPPIMKVLTTKKERKVRMTQLRTVSKLEKILFPIVVTIIVSLILPSAASLVGMLMLGNLFRESGVVARLSDTAQNTLMNIIVIFLGLSVGATTIGTEFLKLQTLMVVGLGLVAFSVGTAGGVLFGKLMYIFTGGKVNPLIGSAGVSAVPMAARVSQKVGQKEDPSNFLLMHAMGPNVAGVIGSAVAAGVIISMCG
ncbi:MAG: sodium ion-translocating decarboxylase subunit beta [Acutalibacteraceae bacterium]